MGVRVGVRVGAGVPAPHGAPSEDPKGGELRCSIGLCHQMILRVENCDARLSIWLKLIDNCVAHR